MQRADVLARFEAMLERIAVAGSDSEQDVFLRGWNEALREAERRLQRAMYCTDTLSGHIGEACESIRALLVEEK